MFYIRFISASPEFLKWLQKKIEKQSSIKGGVKVATRAWMLEFAKTESKKLIKRIYYKEKIPCLLRKVAKTQRILKIDKENNARVAELVDAIA